MKQLYTNEQFLNAKSRELLPFECEKCGKTFHGVKNEIQKSLSRQKRGVRTNYSFRFCSKSCTSNGKNYKCKNCGKIVYRTPTNFRNGTKNVFCSHKCSAIYTQKDGGHCHWTENDKERLRQLSKNNPKFIPGWNKNKKFAKTKTINCIICNNPFTEKLSKSRNRKILVCGKNCRSKIQSINLINQYKNGKKVYGGKTKWLNYKNIKIQGSYEYRTCIILDKWKELNKIKNWEYTKDRFEYIGVDNKPHNYLMDFKVFNNDGTFYYLETKGYEKENDKLKWKSVRNKGFQLEIWFNDEIKSKEKEFMVSIV